MSNRTMNKFRIKTCREVRDGLLISDFIGDEWLLRKDNVLLHRNNRNRRGNVDFHRQCEVNGLYHAMGYIKSHSLRYTYKPKRTRLDYLFSII